MDANFLSIPIISCRETATFQFVPLVTLSKPHLVCTFYDKQINAKKYEWKFESVQVLLLGDYIIAYIGSIRDTGEEI